MIGFQCFLKKRSKTKNRLLIFLFALNSSFIFIACQSKKVDYLKAESIQLASPSIRIDSALFGTSAKVSLNLAEVGATLRYTLDGSLVDENSTQYIDPIEVTETGILKVRAYHPEFSKSDEQYVTFRQLKNDISMADVALLTDPHSSYPGRGSRTLIDGRKGGLNFRNGDYWLGFQDSVVVINLAVGKDLEYDKIVLSVLQDQDSWIFSPSSVDVSSNGNSIGSIKLEESSKAGKKQLQYIEIPITSKNNQQLTITIYPLKGIPDWHPGEGTLPWTFVDEIMVE